MARYGYGATVRLRTPAMGQAGSRQGLFGYPEQAFGYLNHVFRPVTFSSRSFKKCDKKEGDALMVWLEC